MKKLTLFFIALFTFAFANAQSAKEELDLMQAAFGMEKKAMVAEFVKVDAAQKDAFWKLYDEYETARKELGKKRVDLLDKYAREFDKLTNESIDVMMIETIDLQKKTDALVISYSNKIKKATSPVVAFQFYQVESYILSGIRLSILESLPLPDLK
jgi:acyl-CoA hydrolase